MRLYRIKVKELEMDGFKYKGVNILFDPKDNEITVDNFNQYEHTFYIDDMEIERLEEVKQKQLEKEKAQCEKN